MGTVGCHRPHYAGSACLVYSEGSPGVTLHLLSDPEVFSSFWSLPFFLGGLECTSPCQPGMTPKPGPACGSRGRGRRKFQARETDEQRRGITESHGVDSSWRVTIFSKSTEVLFENADSLPFTQNLLYQTRWELGQGLGIFNKCPN